MRSVQAVEQVVQVLAVGLFFNDLLVRALLLLAFGLRGVVGVDVLVHFGGVDARHLVCCEPAHVVYEVV